MVPTHLVVALLLAQSGPADPPAEEPVVLPEQVIVTGNRLPQRQRVTTQAVAAVELDPAPAESTNRNLADLVALQPGTFVATLSRNDANWGSVGGLGPKYSVLLLDGLTIDGFMDGMALDPWALERAELQQGPAGVMHGNALSMDFAGNQSPLSGATNFVLRTPDRAMTRLSAGGGSWGTGGARLYTQDRKGAVSYFAGGSYERSDYTDYGTDGSWLHILNPPNYDRSKLYGRLVWQPAERQSLSLFASHTTHVGDVGRPNRDYGHRYDLVNAAWTAAPADGLDVALRGGLRSYDRNWSEDSYPDLAQASRGHMRELIVPADLSATYRHLGDSVLTAGADLQWVTYQTSTTVAGTTGKGNDATALQLGVYAEEKWVQGPWVARAGARFASTRHDYTLLSGATPGLSQRTWNDLLWSAGLRVNDLGPAALFANLGSSFVAPSAKSVGGTLQPGDAGVPGRNGQLPNPDLVPERGLGGDAGAEVRLLGARLVARGFLNRVTDVIVDNVVSQDPSQTRSVNAGEARSLGFELSIEQRVGGLGAWFANASVVRSEISNGLDADQDGAEVPFVPAWTANVGATIRLPAEVTLTPSVRAVGRYYDSSSKSGRAGFGEFVIPGLQLAKSMAAGEGKRLVLSADLNNLANDRYEMPWGFRDPGFNFFLRAELTVE